MDEVDYELLKLNLNKNKIDMKNKSNLRSF